MSKPEIIFSQALNEDLTAFKSSVTILVADDDAINRIMLSRYLKILGYNVSLAENGRQTMEMIRANAFEAVLLDIDMPELNGFQILQTLKQDPLLRKIPVIMISALDDMDSIIRCIELGAEDYLTKPFNTVLLRARLNACLEKKRLLEQQEKLLERELDRLSRLTELKDQFVSIVSHDLKSPVNVIIGYTDLLEENLAGGQMDAAEVGSHLQRIRANAKKMLALVTDLLDLARIENGGRLNEEAVLLEPFLSTQLSNFELLARQKEISLELQSPLIEVNLDQVLIAQVLDNVISNAIKYTQRGGKVSVVAQIPQAPGDRLLLQVIDNGMGIPAQDLPHLFEKFYRVNTQRHQAIEGTGLGLAIVKAIIDSHNGSIEVESVPDKGSTFNIFLPL